jgi:Family of unknown function (DUF6134)
MRGLTAWLAAAIVLGLTGSGWAQDKTHENRFATIRVDGKKIGQVHYTLTYDEDGEVEEVKTRASYSMLGIKLYSFSQDMHEQWQSGELQAMNGHTDDNGTKYQAALERKPDEYAGTLNNKSVTLPHDAFPSAVWHYQITEQSLLFNIGDFRLLHVQVKQRPEKVTIDGRSIAAERFDFSGDWQASVWFDPDQQLVKFEYKIQGRDVVVTLDQG